MENIKKLRKVVVIGGGFAGLAMVNAMNGANPAIESMHVTQTLEKID